MKLVINNLGKFLVVAIAAALVLVFISASLLPSLSEFVSKAFVAETNYVEQSNLSSAPILKSEFSHVNVAKGENVDIFEHIVATSQNGENLISQLSDDYQKDVSQRKQVFVYRLNSDNTNKLVSSIDTSTVGNWAVFYLLEDGLGSALLKITYSVT